MNKIEASFTYTPLWTPKQDNQGEDINNFEIFKFQIQIKCRLMIFVALELVIIVVRYLPWFAFSNNVLDLGEFFYPV